MTSYAKILATIFWYSSSVNLSIIQSCISDDMQAVDTVIRQSLHSEVPLVDQIAEYIVNSGGKRLRPALVLLSAGLFGPINEKHHQLAAVVEFIHTATLLHDDVVDESSKRRGKYTANAMFGNAASVLVGDFIYSRAFQMMVAIQNMRVMEVLAEATNVIAEGEVLQLLNVHNADITDAAYLQVIHYKTAKLFEAATRLGAIISSSSATDQTVLLNKNALANEAALAEYGMRLGTAFQLIDDVLDLSGDAELIGKNLGDDLAEGKPTLPLLYAMRHGTLEQSAVIRRAIENSGESAGQNADAKLGSSKLKRLDDLPAVLQAVMETGALAHVRQVAKKEAELACAAIAHFGENPFKQALLNLAEFAVNRSY